MSGPSEYGVAEALGGVNSGISILGWVRCGARDADGAGCDVCERVRVCHAAPWQRG